MKTGKIYVIIPALNEQNRIISLLKSVNKYFPPSRVIVVDDGSVPALKISPVYPVWLLRHRINLGKGMAMHTGADFAFNKGAHAVIFLDADGQHNPREIPVFIKYFHQGYDVIFGSRQAGLNTPLIRYLGNKFASLYIRFLFGIYISDILSGYRGLTAEAYQLLHWTSSHYGVETEIVARLGKYKHQLKWTEIPIENIYIDKYKGVTLVQAVRILGESIWWKFT